MKFAKWTSVTAIALVTVLALPLHLAAQDKQDDHHNHHHYKLIDVGTFGGPSSLFSNPDFRVINNRGTATGFADTSIPDPYCVYDCLVNHAFVWKDGVTADLGTLPGGASSFAYSVNNGGLIVGQSQIGSIDPLTGVPKLRGALWARGQIIDLGTLGGTQSNATAINDRGQVVGGALTATPDPFANAPQSACFVLPSNIPCSGFTFAYNSLYSNATTETHAFLWLDGLMLDLGTLGGPDSNAFINNDRGEVAGWSYTSFAANPSTGVPTVDPFLWNPEDGKMTDLGSLGGTFGAPFWLNNRGQVVGASNLPGDQTFHPFLWDRGTLKDLGTLGGYTGTAFWINDAGEAVGYADLPPNPPGCAGLDCIHHAFLWKHGVMKDLGTLNDPCSRAFSINLSGQVVGGTAPCNGEFTRAFLWENGGPIIDLNTLVLHGSGLTVRIGYYINDRGEIAGQGVLPNGDVHAVLLIPCDGDHVDSKGCEEGDSTAAQLGSAARAEVVSSPASPSRGNRTRRGRTEPNN